MLNKTFALAALTGAALITAAPAFADGYRQSHSQRGVAVQNHAPHYAQHRRTAYRPVVQRRVVVQRTVARPAPVVVYRQRSSHDVLGGLILGAMIGAVIANHAGY
jgi:uncharacterized protein YcfJ